MGMIDYIIAVKCPIYKRPTTTIYENFKLKTKTCPACSSGGELYSDNTNSRKN
jgi:hypothetical protein